jgi:hypothetical protein
MNLKSIRRYHGGESWTQSPQNGTRISQSLGNFLAGLAILLACLLTGEGTARADAGALIITPPEALNATGFARGPFTPSSKIYSISNSGPTSVNWSAGRNRPWVSLSASGGTLAPGAKADLTVLINSLALDLPVTNDAADVTFINLSAFATDTRTVNLSIPLPGSATAVPKSVELTGQYHLTLTGEPDSTYVVERATSVTGPWEPIYTNQFSGPSATYDVTVSNDAPHFYRSDSSGTGASAATLGLVKVFGPNSALVQVTGDPYGTYVIESSADGSNWSPVSTNEIPASGELVLTNSMAGMMDNLQYRALAVGSLDLPTLNHVLIVGESMALGFDGTPVLSLTPQDENYRFQSAASSRVLTPLVEVGRETIAASAANHIVSEAPLHHVLMSNVGQAGALYDSQKKGTAIYASGLRQFRDAPQEAAFQLFAYRPRAIFVVGGEGNQLTPDYRSNLRQWQEDYERDIQYLTGFTGTIPMFHSQISAWTSISGGGYDVVTSPYELLAESEANPAKTILVGPRYFLPYAVSGAQFPGLHPTNEGYRWLGEYYGKVYKRVVVDGAAWTPLEPASVTRNGAVITAVFSVPAPPLVLDTTLVVNPGRFGFEYHDDSGAPPAISSVILAGPDTVQITLSDVPTGTNQRLRYAYTGVPGNPGGPTTGPRGNLRDSDAAPSLFGNTLYNWCVHFDKPVN